MHGGWVHIPPCPCPLPAGPQTACSARITLPHHPFPPLPPFTPSPCLQALKLYASSVCEGATYSPPRLAAALALAPCPALELLQSLQLSVPTLPADTLPAVCAQLTQLTSLWVHAMDIVCGPDGRPVPASELLDGLSSLSRLTRLASLKVKGQSPAGEGGPCGDGAPVRDVLLALPPGAPLKEVGRSEGRELDEG